MSLAALTKPLRDKYLLSHRHARMALEDIFTAILAEAAKGKPVTLRGIGTFRRVDPKPRPVPKRPGATTTKKVDPLPTIRFTLCTARRKNMRVTRS